MAVLTWRNVDSPNFNGTSDLLRASSDALARAFSAAQGGLTELQKDRSDTVNSALLADLAGAQTTDAAKAILASISSRPGADQLTTDTLKLAMGRPGDLTRQASDESSLNYTNLTRDWAKTDHARLDDARGAAAAMAEARATGDPAKIAAAQQQYGASLAQLPFEKILSTYSDLQSLEKGGVGLSGDRQRQSQDATTFDWSKLSHDEGIAIKDNVAKYLPAISSADDIDSVLNSDPEYKSLSGAVQLGIRAGLQQLIGAPSGGGASGSAGGGGAQPAYRQGSAYNAVLGDGQFGLPSKPVSEMTIGEAYDFGRNTLIPASKAAGVGRDARGVLGSSALGAYQFTGETLVGSNGKPGLAERTFGANWRNVVMTPENQDRMAERLFNERKNGNLKDTWAGLPNATPGAYANKSWDEVKNLIVQHEVGGNPQAVNRASQGISNALAISSQAGSPNRDFGRDVAAVFNSSADIPQVVAQLTGAADSNVPFAGVVAGAPKEEVAMQVRRIMKEHHIPNAAVAAAVFARSLKSRQDGSFFEKYAGTGILGRALGGQADMGGWFIDKDAERRFAKVLGTDGGAKLVETMLNDTETVGNMQNIATATTAYNQAVAEVKRRQALVNSGAKSPAILGPALVQLKAAKENLDALQGQGVDQVDHTLGTGPKKAQPTKRTQPPAAHFSNSLRTVGKSAPRRNADAEEFLKLYAKSNSILSR